jgi:hypothetical protein
MVAKIVKKMLFSLSVSVALAEYSAENTDEIFGRSHFRSDTTHYHIERVLLRYTITKILFHLNLSHATSEQNLIVQC